MTSGRLRFQRSSLTLLLLGVVLIGCTTLPQSPSEALPPGSSSAPAATGLPSDQAPPARSTDAVAASEADSIYFARRATYIDPVGQDKLRLHAARLKDHPEQVVSLTAYADGLGSASYELAIANQRLEAVAKLLRSYGVARRQVHPLRRYGVARGSTPTCVTADCRDRKGRVVLSYATR
ncbi:MAG TPA: OmpA family protein [Candidatus Accumulibacter phosphatis]|nr:hypothetical protein [Accumulibacter sp.]HCN69588.1 hypothetical protein [Accumulibacter sp.]HRL78085.1 OmpA family protein [Candidatus Accumulibacter phosphatis]HRQ94729.1 OmpA family protein [Candidatus Accumulibacter phosphatis]